MGRRESDPLREQVRESQHLESVAPSGPRTRGHVPTALHIISGNAEAPLIPGVLGSFIVSLSY